MVSFSGSRPPGYPLDMAALTKTMNLGFPVSLTELVGDLSAPTAVQFKSPTARAQGLAGSASWIINAQGFWNFSGNINNSNAITQQFTFGMSIGVRDNNGNLLGTVSPPGQVGPNLPAFSNNASWSQTGFDQRLADLWPAIYGARSAAPGYDLQASINVADVLEVIGISAAALVVAAAALVGPNGKGWVCDPPFSTRDDNGNPVMLHCEPAQ